MSGRDLVTLLYGLALQHSTPPAAWHAAALTAGLSSMTQLDGQGLSNLLYALGLLKWQPGRQWQLAFWDAVVTQVQRPQRQPMPRQPGKPKHRQQQQQDVASGWPQGQAGVGLSGGVPGAAAQAQPGFAPRTWELLLEGQRLLGWQLPLQQLQHLQRHGQLHRLGQAQLGSWAQQAGLSAARAAASGASALELAARRGSAHQPKPRQQQQQQQSASAQQQPARQVQQQQQQLRSSSSTSSNGRSAVGGAGSVAVQQLRVLPPVQLPAARSAMQQASSAHAAGSP
jgi:hypothetical protein